ncbi:MAG: DUF1844 domain-containing protein [candidate division NC10 bacterium]|nr:DUF1844 domain-containing protein [candidate division NC10 bacterium]
MAPERPEQMQDAEEVGFSGLLLMLGTAALAHLGAAPDPAKGEAKLDLAQAKQAIDLLDVLKVKTAGNLTGAESGMLDDLLFDLRMRYLDAVKRA